MYVSRAVRSIQKDPVAGASVRLVLETDSEADREDVVEAVETAGASILRELQFDDLEVSVPHERVDELCKTDGLCAVQTAATIETHADEAEEDVDRSELE